MAERPPERKPQENDRGVELLDQPSRTREKMRAMDEAEARGENPEHVSIDQDPRERQKENQNRDKDDSLGA